MNTLDMKLEFPKVITQRISDEKKEYDLKISLMKETAKDKLYLEDLKEVMDDFKYVDSENIE